MVIMQVVEIGLRCCAGNNLSKNRYDSVSEWLKHWSPINNFQAVIAPNECAALEMTRDELRANLLPSFMADISLDNFYFKVSSQEVIDNRFWLSSQVVYGTEYLINEPK